MYISLTFTYLATYAFLHKNVLSTIAIYEGFFTPNLDILRRNIFNILYYTECFQPELDCRVPDGFQNFGG